MHRSRKKIHGTLPLNGEMNGEKNIQSCTSLDTNYKIIKFIRHSDRIWTEMISFFFPHPVHNYYFWMGKFVDYFLLLSTDIDNTTRGDVNVYFSIHIIGALFGQHQIVSSLRKNIFNTDILC